VEHANVVQNGRQSIRIESKNTYNQGLIIADIAHMPGSICGTWPAFWTIGPDWPTNGEIDIIEGVNSQTFNAMTLHTGPGCSISSNQKALGQVKTSNCDINAPGQGQNVGCGIGTSDPMTYGDGFNNEGGGVYATEWTGEAISIYHFTRSNIPANIMAGNPDPSTWGQPLALFSGCNFASAIKNQTIIFDTTFCGQWAGQQAVWQADAVCSKKAATCEDYVKNNPQDFANAFWQVNSVKVYQNSDGFIGSAPAGPPSSTALIPSAKPSAKPSSSQVLPTTFSTSASAFPPGPPSYIPPSSAQVVTVESTTTMTVDEPTGAAGPGGPSPTSTQAQQSQYTPGKPPANIANQPLDASDFPSQGQPGGIPSPAARKEVTGGHLRHARAHARRHLHGHGHALH